MKKPEYARLYGNQIKELDEKRFSRKLTEKDIEESKRLIRYMAHHAIVRPEKKNCLLRPSLFQQSHA